MFSIGTDTAKYKYISQYQAGVEEYRAVRASFFRSISTNLSRALSYASKHPKLAVNYARLADYLAENPDSLDDNLLERIVGGEGSAEESGDTKKERKPRGPRYVDLNYCAERLKEEEKNAGYRGRGLKSKNTYKSRVRYRIKSGKIESRKKGRKIEVNRRQFEKLVPYLIWMKVEEE